MADDTEVVSEEGKTDEGAAEVGGDETPSAEVDAGAPPDTEAEPEREPGGADPQAVRARKEYRARRAAQQETERLRLENARLQERARMADEQRQKPEQQPMPTPAQVWEAVKDGRVSETDYWRWHSEIYEPYQMDKYARALQAKEAQRRPVQIAQQRLGEYIDAAPYLLDDHEPRTLEIGRKYQQLVSERGYPADERTKLTAIEMVLGPVEKFKNRRQVAAATRDAMNFHSEAGANGARGGEGQTAQAEWKKAPADVQALWDKLGTTPEQRKIEYAHYLNRPQRRAK